MCIRDRVTAPTFAEYATALETVGCTVERHFLREENDFAVTEDILNAVHPGIEMVFLCQPNNPTGQLAQPALVEALLHKCEAVGARLVVDECFLDLLPEGDTLSAKRLLQTSKHLVILKAFTKLYGMAGVRLGYCLCTDEALLARMQAAGQPWAVSSLPPAPDWTRPTAGPLSAFFPEAFRRRRGSNPAGRRPCRRAW